MVEDTYFLRRSSFKFTSKLSTKVWVHVSQQDKVPFNGTAPDGYGSCENQGKRICNSGVFKLQGRRCPSNERVDFLSLSLSVPGPTPCPVVQCFALTVLQLIQIAGWCTSCQRGRGKQGDRGRERGRGRNTESDRVRDRE